MKTYSVKEKLPEPRQIVTAILDDGKKIKAIYKHALFFTQNGKQKLRNVVKWSVETVERRPDQTRTENARMI